MLSSHNEWNPLKKIIVGSATNAHWPVKCQVFRGQELTTQWKDSPVPFGPVDQQIINEANEDLETLSSVLKSLDVVVHRPTDLNFAEFDGMYNYCPRDRVLVVGKNIINAPMLYPTRKIELSAIEQFLDEPIINCIDLAVTFDAANICRLGEDLLYLVSSSGNRAGAEWLQKVLGKEYRIHMLDNIYSGVHIDSTISPVREGLVVLNADRINENNIPEPLKTWDKIWITGSDIVAQEFVNYPYASKYIALNFLTVNPDLVICDPHQYYLRSKLEKYKVDSIGVNLRHSRTLGGGHHCVTLDLLRESI